MRSTGRPLVDNKIILCRIWVDYVNVVCPGGAGAGRRRLGAGGRGAAGAGAGRAGRRARAAQAHHQAGRRPGACHSSWGVPANCNNNIRIGNPFLHVFQNAYISYGIRSCAFYKYSFYKQHYLKE